MVLIGRRPRRRLGIRARIARACRERGRQRERGYRSCRGAEHISARDWIVHGQFYRVSQRVRYSIIIGGIPRRCPVAWGLNPLGGPCLTHLPSSPSSTRTRISSGSCESPSRKPGSSCSSSTSRASSSVRPMPIAPPAALSISEPLVRRGGERSHRHVHADASREAFNPPRRFS